MIQYKYLYLFTVINFVSSLTIKSDNCLPSHSHTLFDQNVRVKPFQRFYIQFPSRDSLQESFNDSNLTALTNSMGVSPLTEKTKILDIVEENLTPDELVKHVSRELFEYYKYLLTTNLSENARLNMILIIESKKSEILASFFQTDPEFHQKLKLLGLYKPNSIL